MQTLTMATNCTVNFGSINLQRAITSTSEIRTIIENLRINILFVQELHVILDLFSALHRILGLGRNIRQIYCRSNRFYAAVLVFELSLDVLVLGHLCTPYTAVDEVTLRNKTLYLVSVYFLLAIDIAPMLNHLALIMDALVGKCVIISDDFKAKSDLWFSTSEDERGSAVEDFATSNSLYILNEPGHLSTFYGPMGSSNIDISLASHQCIRSIYDWTVCSDTFHSDHRLKTFNYRCRVER